MRLLLPEGRLPCGSSCKFGENFVFLPWGSPARRYLLDNHFPAPSQRPGRSCRRDALRFGLPAWSRVRRGSRGDGARCSAIAGDPWALCRCGGSCHLHFQAKVPREGSCDFVLLNVYCKRFLRFSKLIGRVRRANVVRCRSAGLLAWCTDGGREARAVQHRGPCWASLRGWSWS